MTLGDTLCPCRCDNLWQLWQLLVTTLALRVVKTDIVPETTQWQLFGCQCCYPKLSQWRPTWQLWQPVVTTLALWVAKTDTASETTQWQLFGCQCCHLKLSLWQLLLTTLAQGVAKTDTVPVTTLTTLKLSYWQCVDNFMTTLRFVCTLGPVLVWCGSYVKQVAENISSQVSIVMPVQMEINFGWHPLILEIAALYFLNECHSNKNWKYCFFSEKPSLSPQIDPFYETWEMYSSIHVHSVHNKYHFTGFECICYSEIYGTPKNIRWFWCMDHVCTWHLNWYQGGHLLKDKPFWQVNQLGVPYHRKIKTPSFKDTC